MRVCAVLPLYPPKSRVGAFLATHELLTDLTSRGHHVDVFRRLSNEPGYVLDGVHVGPGKDTQALSIAVACADIVISHLGDDGKAARLATRWGKPSVRMAHGHPDAAALRRLAGAHLVVFNSEHLAVEVQWDGPQIVVHPPLRQLATRSGRCVTLVNLSQEKGGELFWRLARRRPDVEFLGVRGGYGLQIPDLPVSTPANIRVVEVVEDMRDVYTQTRVLLMPSERESWGMVALEAAQSGIPTIAHPTAGLLESMGDAAVYADRDREADWLAHIDRLRDYRQWEEASHRARLRVALYDRQSECDRFANAIESLLVAA